MRKAKIFVGGIPAGSLEEHEPGSAYVFRYFHGYDGPDVSLTMPKGDVEFSYHTFPPFFDGLLPEGFQLDALLRQKKIDRQDFFLQLVTVGNDLVGSVTAEEIL